MTSPNQNIGGCVPGILGGVDASDDDAWMTAASSDHLFLARVYAAVVRAGVATRWAVSSGPRVPGQKIKTVFPLP